MTDGTEWTPALARFVLLVAFVVVILARFPGCGASAPLRAHCQARWKAHRKARQKAPCWSGFGVCVAPVVWLEPSSPRRALEPGVWRLESTPRLGFGASRPPRNAPRTRPRGLAPAAFQPSPRAAYRSSRPASRPRPAAVPSPRYQGLPAPDATRIPGNGPWTHLALR